VIKILFLILYSLIITLLYFIHKTSKYISIESFVYLLFFGIFQLLLIGYITTKKIEDDDRIEQTTIAMVETIITTMNDMHIMEEGIDYKNITSGKECSICLDDESDIKLNACSHEFHKKCIIIWIKEKPTCPVCRKNIFHDIL